MEECVVEIETRAKRRIEFEDPLFSNNAPSTFSDV